MGIRSALARIFGGGPIGPRSTSSLAAEAERLSREGETLLQEARRLTNSKLFNAGLWSDEVLRQYASALNLGDIFKMPEEKVCPLTKQLIVDASSMVRPFRQACCRDRACTSGSCAG
jgi:hypothetical protein